MNAYIVYKLITKSEGVPGISDRTYEVWRRFSDFLGLHDKLFEKYISKGIIVPAAPEKSIAAMTKTKATSDPATSREVAVRRARQLERFMRRVVQHPRLRVDCDVRDFLTMEAELPRASQTATLSGAGVKRMFKSVGEVFSKMAFHMEEGDRWFEQTQSHVEELDESLRKLLHLSESLTSTRKELAGAQESMSKGLSMLASCEESTALARALSHLTETEENAAALWAKQSEMDSIRFTESLSEYVGLVGSLKELFAERVRVWQNWQSAQQSLARKREQKARLELSGKNDRASALRDEMDEAIRRMDQLEAEFGDLSKLIREEELFAERVRVWQNWQSAQQSLARKREQKARLELSGKNDRASALRDEMDEAIRRMDQLEAEFGDLSKLIQMNEEGGYLGAMTYQCLYSGILDKLRSSKRDDDRALAAIHVSVSANQLVFQTSLIVKTVNEKLRR
ncbi:PX domain protein [Ancylostoma ceylanicum]|uniref:PX domain protein n=1 Tax=Ancylostoma ceylanicum TaxID=53326 RepID=A0A0D6L4P4_9BILA|nr:PX domain protein [Ancylostoma ceylanicum]